MEEMNAVPPCEYWIRNPQGKLVRAKNLRDAAENGGPGPYALCDAPRISGMPRDGSIWAVAESIPELIRGFEDVKTEDLDELERIFFEYAFAYWRVFPVSEEFVQKVRQYPKTINGQDSMFPHYSIENDHVHFQGSYLSFCSQSSKSEEVQEKIFIVLAGTETNMFTFSIATESEIAKSKYLIKILEVDYYCTGYEVLNDCYGMQSNEIDGYEGMPAFGMPINEMQNPENFIDNKESVLGHIKHCLMYCLNKKYSDTHYDINALRRESISNFRVTRRVSL